MTTTIRVGDCVDLEGEELLYRSLPFVLSCTWCDAGYDVESREQAIALGWTEIERDIYGMGWNDLGYCPLCSKEHRERSTGYDPKPVEPDVPGQEVMEFAATDGKET